jgi:predicted enzyme related to lactoylglutathione lyase
MTEARLQETPELKPGTFCWIELATSDAEGAKNFYTQLFDWTYVDHPMGPDMVYTILRLDEKDVGGLYKLMPEQVSQGVPPHWLSYVLVTNAEESTAKAKDLGATILKEAFDVADMGRMSVIQDPTGAVFALWQAKTHSGSGVYNVPNSFCWNELMTTDTGKDKEFYSGLFGWGADTQNFGPMEYTMFQNGERGAAGMLQITPEMGPIPSNWLVYFAVDDCDAKVQRASELGAQVMKPADDIPGVGRFAVLIDPQGGAFAIIKLETPPQ